MNTASGRDTLHLLKYTFQYTKHSWQISLQQECVAVELQIEENVGKDSV